MRRNSTLAIWLALIMLLMVSAAAVFFLVQRNSQLEADLQLAELEAESADVVSAATREQLLSDITVRKAALDAAVATRDTLAAETELRDNRTQELEAALARQENSLGEVEATLQALAMQVSIIAPAGEVPVPPLEQLDILATARANAGLSLVTIAVDGEQIAQLPGEGQATLNVRAGWTPPDEGTYVIGVEAFAIDGRSESAEVAVSAAYASDVARAAALRERLEETATVQRFPAPAVQEEVIAAEAAVATSGDALLHRLLLTGRAQDDEASIADEAFTLQALELIISDAGYRAYLDAVVNAGLLGYYDPEANAFTTYRPDEQSGEVEQNVAFGRWRGVHDLSHQLQSERLGLDEMNIAAMDGDRLLAARALVEGDAVFLQHQLLTGEELPDEEIDEVRAGLAEAATEATAALPIPLQESFEFAYRFGVPFVQALHNQGGYSLVDGAWREQPVSSEQILHPERYLELDAPTPVLLAPLNDVLGQEWRLVSEDTFGEFLLRQHLGRQPLASAQIDRAASGWGGGRFAVYQGQGSDMPVVVIRLTWDSEDDRNEFLEVYADYLGRRFGGAEIGLDGGRCWQADGVGCLFQIGADTLVVRAPSLDLAQAVAGPQINMSQP